MAREDLAALTAILARLSKIEGTTGSQEFTRVMRALNVLFKDLQETRQERIHQLVRATEALILPTSGKTKTQLAHRCQPFAQAGSDRESALKEAFDLRSDTEYLQDWNRSVQS